MHLSRFLLAVLFTTHVLALPQSPSAPKQADPPPIAPDVNPDLVETGSVAAKSSYDKQIFWDRTVAALWAGFGGIMLGAGGMSLRKTVGEGFFDCLLKKLIAEGKAQDARKRTTIGYVPPAFSLSVRRSMKKCGFPNNVLQSKPDLIEKLTRTLESLREEDDAEGAESLAPPNPKVPALVEVPKPSEETERTAATLSVGSPGGDGLDQQPENVLNGVGDSIHSFADGISQDAGQVGDAAIDLAVGAGGLAASYLLPQAMQQQGG